MADGIKGLSGRMVQAWRQRGRHQTPDPAPSGAAAASTPVNQVPTPDPPPPDLQQPEAKPAPAGKPRRLTPEAAVIFAAAIAVGGGYLGARVGASSAADVTKTAADSAREISELQLAAERDRESREKRGAVYAAFLSNSSAFFYASIDLYDAQTAGRITKRPVPASITNAWMNARFAYQRSINDVFVYGSDTAWARQLAIELPVSPSATSTIPQVSATKVAASKLRFNQQWREFQAQFCKEVPARPRTCALG